MIETVFEPWDEDDGTIHCTTCSGSGWVHGCCDDLCRASGDSAFDSCMNARICFTCEGNGYVEFVLDTRSDLHEILGKALENCAPKKENQP